ncbi:hypothetical protein NSZ01_30090 [Nocardioides szechwanensis]|uniref:Uncharacterized protein n=1 Tax=Nocardioides szechwanensis TaxID=1005944 RepID=A0A1H0DU35_9ACTN|nr:hypothetical protein [Nocardioides szechwanensis]GEP35241.1 hypothetical protein NSZ01_30090 [Nocardioides szechwanensis]SDN73511.1 hypothetical protein SAMN05192576_2667 [Nocardioides szechwanensis]
MSGSCGPAAEQVTRVLGFDCHDVSTVISVRNPFDLAHWTMPVLELVIIGGALFALAHAVRRLRAGDPVNLALWCASLVYLLVTEPPLYFPEWFGLDEIYGFIFAHNQFTVQFMWDRLPLYIVAFYPALSQLAYELVRVLGVFRYRGALVGSVAVAFVCQVFYEIFDQVGPQLKWWAWNYDNMEVNHPALASVPMNSMFLFASVSFAALTYLVVKLAGSRAADGGPRRGWSLTWRIALAGVLAPPAMGLFGIPSGIFGGATPNVTAQAWVLGIELGLVWLAGAWVLLTHVQRRHTYDVEPMTPFARVYPAVYLAGMTVAWLGALPAYLDATDGVTSDGTPVGSGLYVLACYAGAIALLAALYTGRGRRGLAATAE